MRPSNILDMLCTTCNASHLDIGGVLLHVQTRHIAIMVESTRTFRVMARVVMVGRDKRLRKEAILHEPKSRGKDV